MKPVEINILTNLQDLQLHFVRTNQSWLHSIATQQPKLTQLNLRRSDRDDRNEIDQENFGHCPCIHPQVISDVPYFYMQDRFALQQHLIVITDACSSIQRQMICSLNLIHCLIMRCDSA